MKLFLVFICIVNSFFGGVNIERLTDCFDKVSSLFIYNDGKKYLLESGSDKFKRVIKAVKEDTYYCHEMPEFGVDGEKVDENGINKGLWVELCFEKIYKHLGFDFDSLLFEIKTNSFDVDIIRKVNGKIAGQCFYLSLDNSLKKLYYAISDILNE